MVGMEKKELFIILGIFLLALGLRAHILKYDLFFAYDSYWHARHVEEFLKTGVFPKKDLQGFYPIGDEKPEFNFFSAPSFFWITSFFMYKLFTLNAPYSKELWILVLRWIPALFGAVISVAIYFLLRQFSRRLAFIGGFTTAMSPAFAYRTMGGFFEEDSLGFLWFYLSLFFLFKAFKAKNMKNTATNFLFSVFFIFMMMWTWKAAILLPLLSFASLILYFIILGIGYLFSPENAEEIFTKSKKALFLLFLFFLSYFFVDFFIKGNYTNDFLSLVNKYLPITPQNFQNFMNPSEVAQKNFLASMVGEEQPGKYSFGIKYNALILFAVFFILLMPYKFYRDFSRKELDLREFVLYVLVLITFYMAYSKLKFTYYFGIPIAIATAFVFDYALKWSQKRQKSERFFIYFSLLLFLLAGFAGGDYYITSFSPSIDSTEGKALQEAFLWLKLNTPKDAKVLNWWGIGHWLTFLSERYALTDNTNASLDIERAVASFYIDENMDDAYKIAKDYNVNYVLTLESYLSSSQLITFAIYKYKSKNVRDPRIGRYLAEQYSCNYIPEREEFKCGDFVLKKKEYLSLPTKWIPNPNKVIYYGKLPVVFYADPTRNKLYVLNLSANNTTLAKLWFSSEEAKEKFIKVFDNGIVKLYEVK